MYMSPASQIFLASAAALASTAGGFSSLGTHADARSSCFLSNSSCPISTLPRDRSTLVYPGGNTQCLSESDPLYRFQVIPGDTDKLLIFFQGGGVCWSFLSRVACKKEAVPVDAVGIFKRGRSDNPFGRYTIVHILACSGDAHMGMVTNDWGTQAGFANADSALSWALQNVASVDSLVIAGGSSGSLGVQFMAGFVLRRFQGRFSHAGVIADSFAGATPATSQPVLTRQFNFCSTPPVQESGPAVVQSCQEGNLTAPGMYVRAMKAFPSVLFTNINSKTDTFQIVFWNLWAVKERNDPLITADEYIVELNTVWESYSDQPNYVSYLADGSLHDFLDKEVLYTTDASGEAGNGIAPPLLSDWISGLLTAPASTSSVCQGPKSPRSTWSTLQSGRGFCDSAQAGKVLNLSRLLLL